MIIFKALHRKRKHLWYETLLTPNFKAASGYTLQMRLSPFIHTHRAIEMVRVLQNEKLHTLQITCLYFYLPWRFFWSRGKKRADSKNGQTRALQATLLNITLQTVTCKANHLELLAGLAHQQNENGTRSCRRSFRMTHNLNEVNELI